MTETTIQLTGRLTADGLVDLARRLKPLFGTAPGGHLVLDVRGVTFCTPAGMVAVRSALLAARANGLLVQGGKLLRPNNPDVAQYFRRMDVFAGVVSYSDGEAFSRHEPQGFAPVADFADDRTAVTAAMHLADALRATATEARLQPLEWSLSELSENVIEHSGRREGSACAQAWKASRQAELAIADRGIGIVASLKKNARFAEYEDEDLVEIVVERGVTVAAEQGKGQGLYFISRMIEANRGELLIYSGGLMFTQRTTEKSVMRVPSPWPGTIVVARFNLDETLENTDIIGDISGEGSEYGFVEFEE